MNSYIVMLFALNYVEVWSLPNEYVHFSKSFGDNLSLTQTQGRIVGGTDISIEEVPYQISLRENNQHFCGGSIISLKQIVTAAHCTIGKETSKLSIRAGSSKISDGGQEINVATIINHPQYSELAFDYDIAILELSSELSFGSSVAPISLPTANDSWLENTKALVTGWGLTNENSPKNSNTLQGVVVEIVDQKTCQNAYGGSIITDNMICAGVSEGGKDACQEDSGGPLQINNILVGVVSFGSGCGRIGFPGVYASTAAFRTFIKDSTGL